MIIRVKELEYFYIQESISIMLPRAAERGGAEGGGDCSGPPGSGGP